jgi:hypothetical protein
MSNLMRMRINWNYNGPQETRGVVCFVAADHAQWLVLIAL